MSDEFVAVTGGCLCRAVRYEAEVNLREAFYCHCKTCQKTHAAAFATVARIKTTELFIDSGESLLTSFKSSPSKTRYFCSKCGAHIYAYVEGQDEFVLRLGTLDEDPSARPIRHIFVSEKASWYELNKQLDEFDQWPK